MKFQFFFLILKRQGTVWVDLEKNLIKPNFKMVFKSITVIYYCRADTNSAYAGITGTNVVLRHDGLVQMKTKPYIQRSTCHIKIRFFPFDEQKCQLKFGLWTYDWNHVDLQNSTAGPDKSLYLENEQWDLMYSCFKRNLESYICCPTKYVDVTLFVGIRRKPLYYMYKLVMPIVLLSALSMVGFLMPYNVGVVKANLSITLILSMTVFLLLVAETIPKTSEGLPLISKYSSRLDSLEMSQTFCTCNVTVTLQRTNFTVLFTIKPLR